MDTPPSLLLRLQRPGEQAAWQEFVHLYTPLLYYWTRRLGWRGQDADDLVQDVFLTLVQKLPDFTYDRSRSFRSWLRTVLVNRWRERYRRKGVPEARGVDPADLPLEDKGDDLAEAAYRKYLVGRTMQLIQGDFEPTTWAAYWEYVVRGRRVSDVAAELGVNSAVVYAAKCRVLRRLREELQGLLE